MIKKFSVIFIIKQIERMCQENLNNKKSIDLSREQIFDILKIIENLEYSHDFYKNEIENDSIDYNDNYEDFVGLTD